MQLIFYVSLDRSSKIIRSGHGREAIILMAPMVLLPMAIMELAVMLRRIPAYLSTLDESKSYHHIGHIASVFRREFHGVIENQILNVFTIIGGKRHYIIGRHDITLVTR